MPIVLNSNSSPTSASLNLTEAGASIKSSLERLSSGKKVNHPNDDAGELSLDYKIKSLSSRNLATIQNLRNALPYLQLQDSSLGTVGQIFERMAMLRTMASDITINSGDIENYSKEFVELQLQIDQVKYHRFNGMSLFASNDASPNNDGVKGIGTYQRAENGAEQNRLNHTLQSLESFYADMEAAHGRNYEGRYCSRINPPCTQQHARSIKCQHDRTSQSVLKLRTYSDRMNQKMTKSFSRLHPFGVLNRAHAKALHKAKDVMSDIRPSFTNLFSIQHMVTARMSSPSNIN